MVTDDELDGALARLDSAATSEHVRVQTGRLLETLDDPQARQRMEHELGRRRHSRRWRFGIGFAIAGLVVGAPAAAVGVSLWSAHTGIYGGDGTEVVDRSEWLGLDASDAPEAIADAYPTDLRLPRGASSDDVIAPVAKILAEKGVTPYDSSGHVAMQETTVQVFYENAARCLWFREWLDADSASDQERLTTATEGIQDSLTWPATVASDGGGVVDYLQTQADAAAAGDRGWMLIYYGRGCDSYYGNVFQ
jgi:hypothetical protein